MLKVNNVFLSYTKEYYTLNDISLEVANNERVVIIGEKESGKSSLIRVIAGLEKPTKGEIFIKNIDISKVDFAHDVALGYLSCFGAFLNKKSVKENLMYVLKIRKMQKEMINNKVKTALLAYNLDDIKDFKVKDLNEFDKLRVAIARLSLRPIELFVVDDIFENFSEEESLKLAKLIIDLLDANSNSAAIIAVSNTKIAKIFGGRQIRLKFGSIV